MTANPATALNASVLVLNRSYMAIHVVNVKRAFGLMLRGIAEAIHIEENQWANYDFESWREVSEYRARFKQEQAEHDDWVRSINFDLQAPRVIRLLFYDRIPRRTVRLNRRNIFARDENLCQYCGKRFSTSELSLDHVFPQSRGGKTTWENIVCACVDCNVKKGGRTPTEARMKLIREPRQPKHSPLLAIKLDNPKYESWRAFVANAYWSVDLK